MHNMDKIKKNVEELLIEEFGIKPDVRVFAFGGGGGRAASYIYKKGIQGARVIAVNVDEKGLQEVEADKKMLLGKDVLGEHKDTNGEEKVAEYIVSRSKAWILEEAKNADVVVLLSSLGGGMGTGGLLETIKILKENTNKLVITIVILPFSIETKRRERALTALEKIKRYSSKCIVLDSDILLSHPKVKVSRAYEIMYEEIYNFVAKITNITRVEIEKKFREIYLKDMDAIVEEAYRSVLIAA